MQKSVEIADIHNLFFKSDCALPFNQNLDFFYKIAHLASRGTPVYDKIAVLRRDKCAFGAKTLEAALLYYCSCRNPSPRRFIYRIFEYAAATSTGGQR